MDSIRSLPLDQQEYVALMRDTQGMICISLSSFTFWKPRMLIDLRRSLQRVHPRA